MSAPSLKLAGLTLEFGGNRVLADVGFDIEGGTIQALIGPNGAGKSSLFNVISGLYRVRSGSIGFAGHELTKMMPHEIARLGIARTFQNIALFADLNVEENLMLGRHRLTRSEYLAGGLRLPGARREDRVHRARVREIAAFVGVADLLAVRAGELSYGEQKRVDLARALAAEPRLLLLDEPTAGMSGGDRAEIGCSILDIRDALGITILIVEHDMGLIMQLADHVAVLDFGRLIANGPPAEIQADPAVIEAYLGTGAAITAIAAAGAI